MTKGAFVKPRFIPFMAVLRCGNARNRVEWPAFRCPRLVFWRTKKIIYLLSFIEVLRAVSRFRAFCYAS